MLWTFASAVAVTVLGILPAISTAPFSPFGFTTAMLGVIYGNTTMPLRFRHACLFSAVCSAATTIGAFAHPAVDFNLAWTIAFQMAIAASFSLITSYRVERNGRLNYLFASRERLRLSLLSADHEKLVTVSSTDALTGFVNRGHFDRHSAAVFADSSNAGRQSGLLFIDVDYFKRYNDSYGHPAGDGCLRETAVAVAYALRGTDHLAARYGGEEFAILLLDVNQAQVEFVAERVRRAVHAQAIPHLNRTDGVRVVTISVGVGYGVIGEGLTVERLIETADRALYDAKRTGRNRVRFRVPEAA
jgi:diguanylate cyclase (GGDEF)-like protein